jgi:hypothetical protein
VSIVSKTCGSCGLELPSSAFNRAGEGPQHWCRECFRGYFRRSGETHIRQVTATRVKRVAATRERMAVYLAGHPCVDCGEHVDDPRRGFSAPVRRNLRLVHGILARSACVDCGEPDMLVLEFDHVGVKRGQVSKMVFNVSLATLEREIAECEIRCCNCHRRVTAARRRVAREAGSTVSGGPP